MPFPPAPLDDALTDDSPGTDAPPQAAGHVSPHTGYHNAERTAMNETVTEIEAHEADVSAHGGPYQPLDSDLTAIAALTTTAFGRSFLALANAAAGRTLLALGTAATSAIGDFDAAGAAAAAQAASQPLDSDLTAIAALTTTAYGRSLLEAANAAALRTLAGLVIGTNVQAWDADLDTLAAGGAGATTFLRALLDGTYVASSQLNSLVDLIPPVVVKASGGSRLYTVPGIKIVSTAAKAIAADRVYYAPIRVEKTTTFDRMIIDVTTVGAGLSHAAIYECDDDGQPGALVFDPGVDFDVSTTTGIGGRVLTINKTLDRGHYLMAYTSNVAHSVRAVKDAASTGVIIDGTGSIFPLDYRVTKTFAAFADPGTHWDTVAGANAAPGTQHFVFLRPF